MESKAKHTSKAKASERRQLKHNNQSPSSHLFTLTLFSNPSHLLHDAPMTGGQPPPVARKLVVEVIDAHDLLPKDGQGSANPYVVLDFDGQRKRTHTVARTLDPEWHERIEFTVTDPSAMDSEDLEIEVYNDKRAGCTAGAARKSHFLGRLRVYGSQFARKGEEALIYFPLEKKSVFSWIRGEIGLKIYYYDEPIGDGKKPVAADKKVEHGPPPHGDNHKKDLPPDAPQPTDTAVESQPPPPVSVVVVEEAPTAPEPEDPMPPPEVKKMQIASPCTEKVRVHSKRYTGGDLAPRTIPGGKFGSHAADKPDRVPYYLVEPMPYLFVRVVKARGVRQCETAPYVKARAGSHLLRSRPAHDATQGGNPEWNQVFAINHAKPESTLQISLWEGGATESFLGGVCFDLSDVPVRDQPDGPLAPQWYRLEGSEDRDLPVTGDVMVSVWIGTQADDAFPESWNSDAPYMSYTRSKVYQSPKLWYLRVSVLEAQDLHVAQGQPLDVRVKVQMGFQSARTRRSTVSSTSSSTFYWNEDLLFVASEPLDEQMIVLVEDRSTKEPLLVGHVVIPVGSVESRMDEKHVPSKWFNLEGGDIIGGGPPQGPPPEGTTQPPPPPPQPLYSGRVHVRMCLEGGYHVLDEAVHVCSDYRPTAKQLWKPAVGVLELGILGARGLLPMKTKGGAKGSTDAYCVAKYGKKWVRTRTVIDSFDPRWNEQYTWRVYDPCTVLTIGVFDNWRMLADVAEERPDYVIGKIRIRVSTLESNRVYTNSYPLIVLLHSGVKKMGEIEIAVRFACPSLLPDTFALYSRPLLPRMHYLRPIGVAQQEALRFAAIKMVAGWLARSEPPMGQEVVRYMLDADSHTWSIRRSKANWFRIMSVLAWAIGLARWVDDIRRWRNPVTTVLVHLLYLVLVWYPELVVPTGFLYVVLIASWYRRFRPAVPAGMDARLSMAESADADELDEEFDGTPSGKTKEVVRATYERLRTLAARVQTVMGDVAAQGERVQALVSWRDPRATRMFVGGCTMAAVMMYAVPMKMVAVAVGFYFLRHPMFRDPMPPASLNFFRRLPSLSDRLL